MHYHDFEPFVIQIAVLSLSIKNNIVGHPINEGVISYPLDSSDPVSIIIV